MNWISILGAGAMTQASSLSYALTPTGRSAISRAPVTRTGWLILLVLASPVWVPAATAQEPYCPPGETICVGFDGALDAALPLETATKVKVDKRREKEKASKKTTGACRNALEANDEDNIAKHCNKSPKREKSILRNKPIEVGGKQRGKSIKTRTKLSFEKPSQRYGNQNKKKWDKLVFKPPQTGDVIASSWRRQSNTNDKRRNKQFGVVAPVTNDDRDCVDSFTGEHKGGTGIADGDPASCFESGGVLKASLTPEGDGCRHENGTFFYGPWDEDGDGEPAENDCWDADGNLKTTLVELIDEDGASPDNNPSDGGLFDIDGDGLDGEDPPNSDGYAVNDDQDCIDTVTGRHLRAAECFINGNLRQTLSTAYYGCENGNGEFLEEDPYDGIEDQCYDGSGAPQPSTTPLAEGCFHCLAEGCEFAGGATFFEGEYPPADEDNDGTVDENDCYFADGTLKNTLAELVDEDDGLAIDDDADGLFDEDGPDTPADFQQDCHNMAKRLADDDGFDTTGVYTNDGGCDLTRAIIVGANKASLVKNGKKVYKADNQGRFDDSVGGDATEYGYETRSLVIDEDFTVLCTDEEVFDDLTGQCILETQESALQAYRATMSMAPAELDGSLKNYAMMGFTFAPPRVRWGLFYKEELDLYFFTITLFEAKIGYDFALGVGFRLPVEVEVSNLPLDSILAGQHLNPVSEVRPENFSVQQYKDFCTNNAMGNAAYCKRFAFPNALDSSDGDELAIRMTAFAGIKVVILEIPLINWGVDIDMDMPEMCSLYLAYENVEDVAMEMAYKGVGFADAMSSLNLNCGTYTTPYGNDEDGNPVQFPFIQNAPMVNQMIRADCAEAFARGETVKLPSGEVMPLCTGIILGVHGASLGLGVGTDLEMNSNLIKANASARGDSVFLEHQQNGFEQPLQFFAADEGGSEQVDIDTLRVDNYDDSDTEDFARVTLDDFTYCLNNFSIRLKGQAMFGGILTIFPDFPDFTIYRLTLPLGDSCGIPVGQHANTNPVEFPVLVENYGVEVFVETDPADPNRVDDKTLKYPPAKNQPGGDFLVLVKNIGSFPGGFDNFSYELSNQRDQNAPYAFRDRPR